MTRRRRIFLHPGFVYSKYDGDRHYIGVGELASLYGVNPSDCIVVRNEDSIKGHTEQPGDIHLRPRYDGNYAWLPKIGQEQK